MDLKDCHEFICGVCTKSIFKIDNSSDSASTHINDITVPCTKIHNTDRRNYYLQNINIIFDFEKEVYYTYKNLVMQNDRDIENNRKLIAKMGRVRTNKVIEKIYNSFDSNVHRQCFLLKISKEMLKNYEKDENKYQVCDVCSAIIEINTNNMDKLECNHVFHNDYKFLRERTAQLKRKLGL